MPSRWRASEMLACDVSDSAYRRGYGSADEVIRFSKQRVETTDENRNRDVRQFV